MLMQRRGRFYSHFSTLLYVFYCTGYTRNTTVRLGNMVDSLKLQQPLTVGLHSSSKTGSTSVSSESLLLSKKGKKLVGGYDFTPELQSIVNSILELDMCPPPLIHTAKDDENKANLFGEDDDGSPEDWVPTNTVTKTATCRLSTTVRRALAPMPLEEALEALRSALLDRTENKTMSLVPLSTIKAMSDILNSYAAKYPNQSQKAYDIRNQLEKVLLSSTLKFEVKLQEMTK